MRQDRQAEKALGIALQGKREHAVIASKFGRHVALWETDDPTGAEALAGGGLRGCG